MLNTLSIIAGLLSDLISWCALLLRPRNSLEAEVLFLRRQLALYVERDMRPQRIDALTRVSLTFLSRWFDWPSALVVVKPDTLIRWHRAGFKLFWQWKSRPGRPPIPLNLRELIRRIARENPLWGEERIANELLLKLAVRVSPRTVRKYMRRPLGQPRGDQRWSTFLKNHAHAIVACDFFVAVSAIGYEPRYEYLIHDRDCIFSADLDESVRRLGLRVLKSPPRSPKANAICKRVIGTIRRECLDWLIPFSESHLRKILKSWIAHYNMGRPHMALGPGLPDPPRVLPTKSRHRHRLDNLQDLAKPLLGGLHHEYSLAIA